MSNQQLDSLPLGVEEMGSRIDLYIDDEQINYPKVDYPVLFHHLTALAPERSMVR